MPQSTIAMLLLSPLAAAWLAAAVAAIFIGLRGRATAVRAEGDACAIAELLAAAPVVPMLVHPDGRIEVEARTAAWLGLDEPPARLGDLVAAGFNAADISRLERAILTTFASGRALSEQIPLPGAGRTLCLQGAPYSGPATAAGAVLLWIGDVSDTREAIAKLTAERDRLGAALDGLSALIEAAPFPIWHRGPDLNLALVNGAYVNAVEAETATDAVNRGMELIEAGGEGTPFAVARRTRESGVPTSRAAPAIIAGQRRMMRVVDVPIGAGGVAGFAMDVQELDDARTDLARYAQAQRGMLDRLSAGVVQFGSDQTLVFYNVNFARLFALEPDWLADRPEFDRVLERMRDAQRVHESRDFRAWKNERRAWFHSAEPVEENWMLPGGMHIRVVAQPLPDGGLLLIFEDRTEHLKLASARDTLLRVRTATFDNLFEAIGVFAADGRLHLWNHRFCEVWDLDESELVLHPRVDALVQTIASRLADPSRAGLIRDLVRFATVERQQRSGRIAMKDGRHFEFAAVPLPDGNALFTLLDITASRGIEEALRDRNEALEEANRLKNDFVANMSYELRVPLTSIVGFAEMLDGGYAGTLGETAREYVHAILSAVSRLGTLIGDVLDLSQSEAGSLPLAAEPVALAGLIEEAARAAAAQAEAAGLILAVDIAADSGIVSGDRQRLRQCLDHLLGNAIAYTPAGGRVLVKSRAAGQQAEIVISDNGAGIPPANRERIFDLMGQVRSRDTGTAESRARERHGGVGLPLARQLVESHGGKLTLDSEVGGGTSAMIHLPLAENSRAVLS